MTRCAPRSLARALAAAVPLLLLASPSAAAPVDGKATTPPVPVYDVYVTSPVDVVSGVTTVREIDREDMRQEGARTLDEALVHAPSVIVRTGGEGAPRIDIRGLRTRQLLTLIDGVPFYSTDDDAFDPSLIPTRIIEQVDILYSNSSVLYGDGPIAGVIQIRTRSGEPGIHPEAGTDIRENDQYQGEAALSGAAHGVEGFVAGRYFTRDGYPLPESFRATPLENGGQRDNSDRDQTNLFGKVGYVFGDRGRVDVLADYRHADYGVPWRVEQNTDFVGRARFERVQDVEGFTTQLSGQLAATERASLRSWGFVTRQEENRSSYDDADLDSFTRSGTGELDGTALITGGAVHGRIDGGRLGVLRLAANGRYEQFDDAGRTVAVNNGPLVPFEGRDGFGAWSVGAEYEVKPLEPVGLVLGYAHAFLDGDQGVDDDGGIFLAGGYVDLPTHTRLRVSAAHKLRFPSLRQLYSADGGNRDLDSERCWCFEAGVTQAIGPRLALSVTGYWMELRDFIERDDTSDLYENRQELVSRGFEATLLARPWDPVLLRVAYTYLDARDQSNGSPYDRLDNRPANKVDGEVRVALPWDMTARAAVTALGDNVIYARNPPYEKSHLDSFAIFDVRLEQRLLESRLALYFGVDNLFDEDSEINVAFPQAGQVIYGGLDLRF